MLLKPCSAAQLLPCPLLMECGRPGDPESYHFLFCSPLHARWPILISLVGQGWGEVLHLFGPFPDYKYLFICKLPVPLLRPFFFQWHLEYVSASWLTQSHKKCCNRNQLAVRQEFMLPAQSARSPHLVDGDLWSCRSFGVNGIGFFPGPEACFWIPCLVWESQPLPEL